MPAKLDDGTPVYINLFSQKAFKYESGKQIQVDLPDIGHRFQGLIEAMSEAIAETDDELMEKFFGGEPFTTEEIVEGMRKGVKDGLITPVFCGSAVNMQALDMLLFNMHKLLPSPEHEASTLAEDANGEPVELHCTEDEPTAAYVFKTVADQYGKYSYVKVLSGVIKPNMSLVTATTGETEKLGRIYIMRVNKATETDELGVGDIGAIGKMEKVRTGDTLCAEGKEIVLEKIEFAKPVIDVAIEPKTKAEQDKMSLALTKLAEEDPTFQVSTNHETGQTIIAGMGELHLEIIVDRLLREFKVDANVGKPQVAYRETAGHDVEKAEGKFVRQSGGRGQYGHAVIKLEKMEEGFGYEFVNAIVGGVVPKEYIPSIDKGIQEALNTGVIAGFPVLGV